MNQPDLLHSGEAITAPIGGRIVRSSWKRNVLTFIMVFGPGLIVMEADNDAGAVSIYVQAGAQYGTHLLWILLLLLLSPISFRRWSFAWASQRAKDTLP